MSRRLFLLEDEIASTWAPFSNTRPVGELLFGALLLRERIEHAVGLSTTGYLAPAALSGFEETGAPPVDSVERPSSMDAAADVERLVLNSRFQPPLAGESTFPSLTLPPPFETPEGARIVVGGRTAGWILPPAAPLPRESEGALPTELPEIELPGRWLPDPWTVMSQNPDRIAADLSLLFPAEGGRGARPLEAPPGVHRLGSHTVTHGKGVEIEPGVILDATEGPIHLADGVHVRSLTRLEGPAWIGPGTVLLGGSIGRLSCGPLCKLHGEIDSSIVLGYSNKAHGGYLGHAIVGRWVNLGAMTTNSDLKNTYGSVRVPRPDGVGELDTGLTKVGVFLGDHAKTGIGALLNTGSMIGAGSNLFGAALPPRFVPPFSWGSGSDLAVYRKEAFLTNAERMMARRDVVLTEGMRALLSRAWDRARGDAPEDPGSGNAGEDGGVASESRSE